MKGYHGSYVCYSPDDMQQDLYQGLVRKFGQGVQMGTGRGGQREGFYFYANVDNQLAFETAANHAKGRADRVWLWEFENWGGIGGTPTACKSDERALPVVYEVEIPFPSDYVFLDTELALSALAPWLYENQKEIRALGDVPHSSKRGAVITAPRYLGELFGYTLDSSSTTDEWGEGSLHHRYAKGDFLFNLKNFRVLAPSSDSKSEDEYYHAIESMNPVPDHYTLYYTASPARKKLSSLEPVEVEWWDFGWERMNRSGWTEHLINVITELSDQVGGNLRGKLLQAAYQLPERRNRANAMKWAGRSLPIQKMWVGYPVSLPDGRQSSSFTWNFLPVTHSRQIPSVVRVLEHKIEGVAQWRL